MVFYDKPINQPSNGVNAVTVQAFPYEELLKMTCRM